MRHPEFPIVSFLLLPLILASLPSHIRSRSIPMISLSLWLALLNIIRGVNAIAWAGNVDIKLLVWCDITTKLVIGFTFAVPLSALCICRQLEYVSSTRQVMLDHRDKRRRNIFDAILCFGVPTIFMALHYIVQGHRFDIIEDIGCNPTTYISLPAVLLMWVPPLFISLISMGYALAAFHHFLKRRIEFASVLRSSNSAISPSRYFRLMTLAIFEILWDTGNNIYILWFNTFTGLRPWVSWDYVHLDFSRVGQYPLFLIPVSFQIQAIWQWWIIPISSFAYFFFFGFGAEAMSDYRAGLQWIRRTIFHIQDKPVMPAILPLHRCVLLSTFFPP
ncbi:hypothetical protein M422DRAFT_164105 [Sphaerobolus stellatus SS14]|nr:hypothetical protein M422DRAFT_164105 [Sphaerobolus stellatus SS14]